MRRQLLWSQGVALIVATLALGACDPPESVTAESAPAAVGAPAKPTIAPQPLFSWQALAPSSIVAGGPPVQLSLSSGYGSLIYSTAAVSPGQTVSFKFNASGPKDAQLRVVLMRHCGDGPETDNASQVFSLTGSTQPLMLQHTFKQAHPCLRVMFASPTATAIDVSIDQWVLTVPPPAAAAPAPETPAPITPPAPAPATPAPAQPT